MKLLLAGLIAAVLVLCQLSACRPQPLAEFQQHETAYQRAAELIVSREKCATKDLSQVVDSDVVPPNVYWILSRRRATGTFVIEFHRYKGFPLKHGGFLYDESDNPGGDPSVKGRWPKLIRLKQNWYSFSD